MSPDFGDGVPNVAGGHLEVNPLVQPTEEGV